MNSSPVRKIVPAKVMYVTRDSILNAPKYYRRKILGCCYQGGGYIRSRFGHSRVLRSCLPASSFLPSERTTTQAFRTVYYPPSYFTGKLSRFIRAHQAVARARATDDFVATCRRYNLIPVYIPLRRPYRPCQVIRMAKRAGELFVREKVRSAYRRWLAKKLAPFVASRKTTPTEQQQQRARKVRSKRMVSSATRVLTPPAAVSGVANVELWMNRTSTPIFPLPIVRHPARFCRNRINRKRVCSFVRQPTPPLYLTELISEERLLLILSEARSETRIRQKQREDLLRRIKQLQTRAHQRREQGETHKCLRNLPNFAGRVESAAVREMWRKRYLEAKKVTPRLEEECNRLRQELEKLHRELLAKVQAGVWALLTISGKTERPSNKLSYKIMIARLLQEIEDLTRRVEGTRLRLHTEVKLRAMAEKDVRNLREELLKKKIQVTLTRNQEQAAMGNGLRQQYFISAV